MDLLENSAITNLSTWRPASDQKWVAQLAHITVYMGHETLRPDTNTTQHP